MRRRSCGSARGLPRAARASALDGDAKCYLAPMPLADNKQKILAALSDLADDASIEEAIERLHVLAKIERGLAQLDAGQFVEHEEVKRLFCL